MSFLFLFPEKLVRNFLVVKKGMRKRKPFGLVQFRESSLSSIFFGRGRSKRGNEYVYLLLKATGYYNPM